MADVIKVLGQLAAAATTEEDLYAVPNLAQTTTSSLVVANRTASTITFRVSVSAAGAGTSNKDYLYYDVPLDGNSTMTAILGLTLAQTDTIRTYASASGLSFNLFGVETS